SSGFNLARIFGPGVAAAVIAKAGISWCFGLNALSYFTVLIGLSRIQLPPWHPPLTTGSPLHGMLEGIRYIRATKKVSTLIRFIAVFSVLGVPYIILMPVVARRRRAQWCAGARGSGRSSPARQAARRRGVYVCVPADHVRAGARRVASLPDPAGDGLQHDRHERGGEQHVAIARRRRVPWPTHVGVLVDL